MAKVTRLQFSFDTLAEDKDWDTSVQVELLKNNHLFASKQISGQVPPVSGAQPNDYWKPGFNTGPMDMDLIGVVTDADLSGSNFKVTIKTNGSDGWSFDAHLYVTFDTIPVQAYVWPNQHLEGKNGNNHQDAVPIFL